MSATEVFMALWMAAPSGKCWGPPTTLERFSPTLWIMTCASCMATSTVSGNTACDELSEITSELPEVGIDVEAVLRL
eukprot:CAMPEP_0203987016 /NCGR_PEP_ID=MMETSP0360-20130528/6453_1 /ASSEMBLY_ACC=CAM_ASM_000342 /TAXON_ID=268821 /ORGANISM="Scrippsiella Hangoei, Strain SHTV-5" /LENGTH=76 /DNA_ID=CAMNT_0050926573 /DNA_START=19 /DNA_END=246 /DNA_ORIENTATION=+